MDRWFGGSKIFFINFPKIFKTFSVMLQQQQLQQ